jgi:hypothetical protein
MMDEWSGQGLVGCYVETEDRSGWVVAVDDENQTMTVDWDGGNIEIMPLYELAMMRVS